MTAAENIFVGRMPKKIAGFIDFKKMNRDCAKLLTGLGITHIDPKILVKNLSVSEI
jgi:ribose transport system ATP-binding protein